MFGNTGVNEPSAADRLLQNAGVSNHIIQTPAEQLAIQKAENRLQGKPLKSGPALIRQTLALRAEDQLRDAIASKNQAAIDAANANLAVLLAHHQITVVERNRIEKDARGSRLQSIFGTLSPEDALDVYDVATTTEKRELYPLLQRKYSKWMGSLEKLGQYPARPETLDPDNRDLYERFRGVSAPPLPAVLPPPVPLS